MPNRRLRDILRGQNLLHVVSTTDVLSVAQQMVSRNVAAVLIIDAGALQGIFTERDLLRRVVATEQDPAKTVIKDVMTTDVLTVDADRTGFEAYRIMHENAVRHVAVVGLEGIGYGVASIRDFRFGELKNYDNELEFEERVWEEI